MTVLNEKNELHPSEWRIRHLSKRTIKGEMEVAVRNRKNENGEWK